MTGRTPPKDSRAITLFGWDLYFVAFFGIGATFVLIAICWLFFSGLPIPKYCHAGYRNSSICGWIERSNRAASKP